MNLGAYDITIDFSKLFVHNSTSIYFKEGDLNTAKVRAKLIMQRKVIALTGCNVVVKIETMTGGRIDDTATIIDAANGIVEIDFKSNTLVEGTNFFELKIVKGESVKESPKLAYRVLDSIEDAGSIEATNEYPILIQLINDTNKAIEDANEALELANTMKTNLEEVIDNANSAISNATDATNNANTAATNATNKITEVDNAKNDMTEDINKSKETMIADINKAIEKMNNDFNSLSASQQQDAEVILARDGEESLNARLKRDLYVNGKTLKQEVLDLESLKEVQEMSYETEKGYLICKETKKGAVKDFKISGKSSINYCNSLVENFEISATLNSKICDFEFKAGKPYTLVVDFGVGGATSQNNDDIFICQASLAYENIKGVDAKGVIARRIIPKENVKGWLMGSRSGLVGKVTAKNFMILEGDHTQNTPQFFKGIASVGTGTDKIEISSVKLDGNLFDSVSILNTKSTIDKASYKWFIFRGEPNTTYSFSSTLSKEERTRLNMKVTDKAYSKTFLWIFHLSSPSNSPYTFATDENGEVGIAWSNPNGLSNEELLRLFNAITMSKEVKPSLYKSDKKALLFKDVDGSWKPIKELRSCPECFDTVESHNDGKYYYHMRTEKKPYTTGDENNPKVITDKTNTIAKLAKEKVFEVNPLFIETYENGTMILVNSEIVNATMEFKISSYITNLILLNQQRISLLENQLYKTNLANFTVALNTLDTKLKLEQLTKAPK